jgi:Holliday junction resolvasome RuvABC DNA-binding subunit
MTREELQVFIKMPGITKQKLEKIILYLKNKKFSKYQKFLSIK